MAKKPLPIVTVTLDKIVGGGQILATMDDGRKLFVWGGLPEEEVEVQITKRKSKLAEGVVDSVIKSSPNRVDPHDHDSYLSTSPWQIMSFETEQHYKAALIEEAFELHDIVLPEPIDVFTDNNQYGYRNKIEFSWWWDKEAETLDLAFFRRGTNGKIPVAGTSLARPEINQAAVTLRDILRKKSEIRASDLKTALIRCERSGKTITQLYVKNEEFKPLTTADFDVLQENGVSGFELIYSNPKSPASVITKRLQSYGEVSLQDKILDVPFKYAVEGFFQINLPVYEQSLHDMKKWIDPDKPTVDLYSGVGTIGLTVGSHDLTLVEVNEHAIREMRANIQSLGREDGAEVILSESEKVLDYIHGDATIVVDPPRAGLHDDVVKRLLETAPKRIVYLSCNPVTQARDTAKLAEKYGIKYHRGYNFFPRTPHIEHLVVLDLKQT